MESIRYQSLLQKDKQPKQSSKWQLDNVSKHRRSYTPGHYQRHAVASSDIMSKTFIVSSQHSTTSVYRLQNETIMKSTTSGQHITTFSQGEEPMSMEDELHQETNYDISGLNCVSITAAECVCQDERPQKTYQEVDGYESGETKMTDVLRLCKDCKNLYKKVRKRKQPAMVTDPHTTDPRPWYIKSWMFVNQVSGRRSRKTLKRGLRSVLRRLRDLRISKCSPTARIYWTCCRLHLFLKRNVRSCRERQKKLLFKNQSGKKRKHPNSGSTSRRSKKAASSKQAEDTVPQTGKKSHKPYSFVLDSSQEEETGPHIKRYKLEIKNSGKKPLLTHRKTLNSTSAGLTHSPSSHSGSMMPLDERGATGQPLVTNTHVYDAIRPHVQVGSFREQLEKLNMGLLKSAIINEN
ncbi:uncharacterized protein [Dendropsophus ebraccatus]|uniref:uncharacterized protein isoform X2 n=1 Tax=Dendropsophus ebraccatus TaxID=150705 RepID=UPI003831583E